MSQKLSRRELLKVLAVATGAAAISTIPSKWKTPIVEIGALPAHAQGSQRGSIQVTINGCSQLKPQSAHKPKGGPAWQVQVVGGAVNTTVDVTDPVNPIDPWVVTISNLPAGTYTVNLIDVDYCVPGPADTLASVVVTPPGTTKITFNECCD